MSGTELPRPMLFSHAPHLFPRTPVRGPASDLGTNQLKFNVCARFVATKIGTSMTHRTRQRHLATAVIIALSLVLSTVSCHRADRPNVLVITIDTLRVDHLGCYGFTLARTPAIDKLAGESVRFTDAIASAPITMPAHSSIFTGLFPTAHGVRDNGAYALGENAVTLADRLRAAGYTTHAFVSALVLNRRYNLSKGFET